jgi:hypothetical protein
MSIGNASDCAISPALFGQARRHAGEVDVGFRWRAVGVVPLMTVTRLSDDVALHAAAVDGMRGSKRTWFRASTFDT